MDSSSDSDIPPLAKIPHGSRATPNPTYNRNRPTLEKLTTGDDLFRKNSNRKNGKLYSNLVKETIFNSLDHKVALENGHILRKSVLAIKGKILRGPSKTLVNTQPKSTDSSCVPSLAGKGKTSPPKKSTRANHQKNTTSGNSTCGNPTSTQTSTNSSTEVIVIPDSPQKL